MGTRCAVLAAGVLLATVSANAQEQGQTGIAMGYPSSIGVIWHATDNLAIRPEVSFNLRRFSIFGEIGLGASRADGASTFDGQKPKATAWGTRTSVGVIFYP